MILENLIFLLPVLFFTKQIGEEEWHRSFMNPRVENISYSKNEHYYYCN